MQHIEEQLKRIGCTFRLWGRSELKELTKILMPDEIITGCANGRYEGGFAMLCVTNLRLLLVDHKPLFLNLEDLRFDMIAEMDFNERLLDSTIYIITPNRTLTFTSWSGSRLRNILNYTQQRVMEIRQTGVPNQFPWQFQSQDRSRQHAPLVGGLAMRAMGHAGLPLNPYTRVPMLMRRRTVPKFY